MRNRMYGGVRGRKTKVGRKLLRFPPTRFYCDATNTSITYITHITNIYRPRFRLCVAGRIIAAD